MGYSILLLCCRESPVWFCGEGATRLSESLSKAGAWSLKKPESLISSLLQKPFGPWVLILRMTLVAVWTCDLKQVTSWLCSLESFFSNWWDWTRQSLVPSSSQVPWFTARYYSIYLSRTLGLLVFENLVSNSMNQQAILIEGAGLSGLMIWKQRVNVSTWRKIRSGGRLWKTLKARWRASNFILSTEGSDWRVLSRSGVIWLELGLERLIEWQHGKNPEASKLGGHDNNNVSHSHTHPQHQSWSMRWRVQSHMRLRDYLMICKPQLWKL